VFAPPTDDVVCEVDDRSLSFAEHDGVDTGRMPENPLRH
jgi:hypothetical protein